MPTGVVRVLSFSGYKARRAHYIIYEYTLKCYLVIRLCALRLFLSHFSSSRESVKNEFTSRSLRRTKDNYREQTLVEYSFVETVCDTPVRLTFYRQQRKREIFYHEPTARKMSRHIENGTWDEHVMCSL